MNAVRVLPWGVADGPHDMAADEALLASAASGTASLRFYGWPEATLSLGYFQGHAAARALPELAGLPWVRRPSGGMALVHHHELTYALALPAGAAWRPAGGSWLVLVHESIRQALARLGVDSDLCDEPLARGEVLCFLHHTPGDLLVDGRKVAGSAQRKQRGALMQHGSVLLRRSPHTPALPGVAELTGRALAPDQLAKEIAEALRDRLGWALAPGTWTDEEVRLTAELRASRYGSAAWNERH